jgi:D-glycerate 3-kinase
MRASGCALHYRGPMTSPLHARSYTARCHSADFVAGVLDDALGHGARVYAIGGVQGSGKTTLATEVVALARQRGLRVAALSIDDFYLGPRERRRLGHEVHPLLATRGPPGTHDVALACEVIDHLRAGRPVRVPRFDKLGDRRLPPSRWRRVQAVDLVVVEGWFLKTPPQAAQELLVPINALERDHDRDGRWRGYCNEALGRDYPPLWSRLDRMLLLQAPGFEVVPGWRWEQEQGLRAANPRLPGMTRPQVERFVQLFERLSRHALRVLPAIAERTVRLDAMRRPTGDPRE